MNCSSRQAPSGSAPSRPVHSQAGRRPLPGVSRATPIKRGGRLDLGPRVGSGARRAVRPDPHSRALGQGAHLRLPRRVGPQPERQARTRGVVQDRQQDRDPLDPEEGDQVPQRQGAHGGRRRLLGRQDAQPAAAGQHLHRCPGAGDRGRGRRLEVRGAAAAEAARRPGDRVLRLGSLRTDRPRGLLRERDQRLPERDRHRPVQDDRLQPERPRRAHRQPELLEVGAAVHGRDHAEDADRRAGPSRSAAGRCRSTAAPSPSTSPGRSRT